MKKNLLRTMILMSAIFAAAEVHSAPLITAVNNNETPMGYSRYIKPGETGIILTGTGFGASQGSGQVYLATGPYHTGSLTETAQTVTSWGSTSITFTASNATGFSHGQFVFVLVKENGGTYSEPGLPAYIWKTTPTPTAVTGTLTHNSTVTVLGADFLTRTDDHTDSTKVMYMFDDFNRASSAMSTNPYRAWDRQASNEASLSISASSPRTGRSGDNYLHRVGATGTDTLVTYMGDKSEYHFMGWIRLNVSYTGGTQQIKFNRQYGSGDTGEDWYILHSGSNGWDYAEDGGSDPYVACTQYENEPDITGNTWVFYENYVRHASCSSCLDGEQWFKFNNRIGFDYWRNFNVRERQPVDCDPGQSFMGGEYQNNNGHAGQLQTFPSYDDGWVGGAYADADDEVYDASRAKILLGSASTYLQNTGFEIQIPTVWMSTSISFRINGGAIADGSIDDSYLYIVDKFGIVNENGFQLNSSTNAAPSVNAGSDQEITLPDDSVDLDGTVSDDVGVVGSTWTEVSGPGTVTFGNDNAVDTTAQFSEAGTYVLQLAASDGQLETTDTMQVVVNAEEVGGGTGSAKGLMKGRGRISGRGFYR